MQRKVYVVKPYLPPLEEVIDKLRDIYAREILTNGGPEEVEFERRMAEFLNTPYFFFVTNGTIALQLALAAACINSGEIITTPFTYVATTSAILWERCVPVYVDIDESTYNIDPEKIEAAITSDTRAILPVHVFGHPCDTGAIEEIAKKHNIPVIYDAAHAFNVRKKGMPVTSCGDISTISFHATKAFHTLEGGACVTSVPALAERIRWLKKFGHNGDNHMMTGINGKQDEFNAAIGNLNLDHLEEIYAGRKTAWELYESLLSGKYRIRKIDSDVEYNYAYFPIEFPSESHLLDKVGQLNALGIYPRRYFYPSLTRLPYLKHKNACPIAEDISKRILCLPLAACLPYETIKTICDVLSL